jgi:hypothetical protein
VKGDHGMRFFVVILYEIFKKHLARLRLIVGGIVYTLRVRCFAELEF